MLCILESCLWQWHNEACRIERKTVVREATLYAAVVLEARDECMGGEGKVEMLMGADGGNIGRARTQVLCGSTKEKETTPRGGCCMGRIRARRLCLKVN